MADWVVDRIIHFRSKDFIKNGLSHFGFHDRTGNRYAINHQKPFLGLIGENDQLNWTVAAQRAFEGTPNIAAKLNYPSSYFASYAPVSKLNSHRNYFRNWIKIHGETLPE